MGNGQGKFSFFLASGVVAVLGLNTRKVVSCAIFGSTMIFHGEVVLG